MFAEVDRVSEEGLSQHREAETYAIHASVRSHHPWGGKGTLESKD